MSQVRQQGQAFHPPSFSEESVSSFSPAVLARSHAVRVLILMDAAAGEQPAPASCPGHEQRAWLGPVLLPGDALAW